MKTYVIGWEPVPDKIYVYKSESDAAIRAAHWTTIEAEDANQAKEIYIEKYKPEVEE
jgi:hypothetical protein